MMKAETGRALWSALHGFSSLVSHDQEIFLQSWFVEAQEKLSCETCFRKLQRFLKRYPPDFGEGFTLWGICLHDFVNRELGRELFRPDLTKDLLTAKGIFQ